MRGWALAPGRARAADREVARGPAPGHDGLTRFARSPWLNIMVGAGHVSTAPL